MYAIKVDIFIAFYMHFADPPPDESQGETDCCGFSVYSVVVQIEIILPIRWLRYLLADRSSQQISCTNDFYLINRPIAEKMARIMSIRLDSP